MYTEPRTLHRSADPVIAGVCGGIAEHLGWPPNRFRLAFALISIFSAGFPGILVYCFLWFVMPNPDRR
jgi:phage shock protein C